MTRKKLVRYAYASNYKWSAVPRKEARYNVEWKTFTPENLGVQPGFSAMGVRSVRREGDKLRLSFEVLVADGVTESVKVRYLYNKP